MAKDVIHTVHTKRKKSLMNSPINSPKKECMSIELYLTHLAVQKLRNYVLENKISIYSTDAKINPSDSLTAHLIKTFEKKEPYLFLSACDLGES